MGAAPGRALVVAVDHSEGSYKAVRFAMDHLYREGDVLHLLHVVPASSTPTLSQGLSLAHQLPPEEGLQEAMAQHAAAYFAAWAEQLAGERGVQCELDLVRGACNTSLSTEICRKVDDLAAAVVVLNVSRTSWLDELFGVPAVNKQVAERCSRPTLIYRDA